MVIFHCYVSLPEGSNPGANVAGSVLFFQATSYPFCIFLLIEICWNIVPYDPIWLTINHSDKKLDYIPWNAIFILFISR